MKFSLLFAFVALLGAGTQLMLSAQVGPAEWTTLRPEGEEFNVLIPKDWTADAGEYTYHKMALKTRLYLSAAKPGPVFAVASISGIKSNPAYSEFERLNSYVDAFKTWFPGKIRGKEAILKFNLVGEKTLNGNAGREYRLTIADLTGTAQVYSTKRRFYAVVVLDTKKDDALQERFLSSFVLPEKVVAPPPAVAQQQSEPAPTPAASPEEKKAPERENAAPTTEPANSEAKPAEAKPAETPLRPGETRTVSGGVLNGKALYLPKPDYPPEAIAAKAAGNVVIQVTIDEQGAVIAAKPVSGHPALQQACVNAALQARFSPTTLMGEPVKVAGVITYNFVH